MRYYSEEDVSEMLAKEFDEACSYSKPYSGVKMSDYHSIEIPQTDWHTGTPTEEGWYLFSYKYLDTIRYGTDCFLDGKWVFNPALDEKILAYQKIEPYKEANNGTDS